MKTQLLSLLLMAGLPAIQAQTEVPVGFLWHVNIDSSNFWLAGSVHVGQKDLYPLPEVYTKAYRQADHVIFELKDDAETLEEMIFTYAKKDILEEGQYLNNYLSQESKEILSVLFKGKEEKLSRYYEYEGWLLNMAISGMKYNLIGYDPELSVDKYFHDLALADQKPVYGLEQLETQLKLFDFDAPVENQVQIIEAALGQAKTQARNDQAIIDAYYNQDAEAFREAFLTLLDLKNPQRKVIYDLVFVNRNKVWVEKLIDLSKTQPGSYFMLVGSGHYFGPDNLIELLEKEGYQVTPYNTLAN